MAHVEHSFATAGVLVVLTVAGMLGQQPPAAPPAAPRNYRPVTAERLKTPDAGDWLMVRRTYDGWGYSPLKQITPANVSRLQPVWTFATGQENGHEAPPIVNSGVMFVATPGNQVIALDAKSGQLIWRYRRPLPEGVVLLHPTSRGVALHGDKVLFAAGEAVLVALDAKTGKEIWTTTVADNSQGYYMSLAPLVVGSTVMIGASGGEFGVRGFIAAYDIENGRERWKTYMVPAPGEPGSETWPKGDQWKTGGGSILGHGQLRSRDEPRLLGHRQRRTVDGRSTPGRQPLHVIHGRDRRGHRRHQRPLSIPSERLVGLGRGVAADPG